MIVAALAAAHTPVLRFGVNRFVLGTSGVQIVKADRLSVDPLALFGGTVAFAGSGIELQHALIPYRMALGEITGRTSFSGAALKAHYRIGSYAGDLDLTRQAGALATATSVIGNPSAPILLLRYRADKNGMPHAYVRGRDTAPLFAALFERSTTAAASLPAEIDIDLAERRPGLLGLAYKLKGPKLDMEGHGAADIDAKKLVHEGRFRLVSDDKAKDAAANKYGAIRGQIELAANRIVPFLRTYAVDSKLDVTLADSSGVARYGVTLAANGKPTGPIGRLVLATSGGDATAAPSMPVVDLAIDDAGKPGHLKLDGTTGVLGGLRRVAVELDAPKDGHVDAIETRLGEGSATLAATFAFREALVGHDTSLEIKAKGAVADPRPDPALSAAFALLAEAGRVVAPGAPLVGVDGTITLDPGQTQLSGLKIGVGGTRITVDGKMGHVGDRLTVDTQMAAIDQASLNRLSDIATRIARLPGSGMPAPAFDATGKIGRLRLSGATVDQVAYTYSAKAADASFGRIVAGGRQVASSGKVGLKWPLPAGQALTGQAETQWGHVALTYRPADGRDPSKMVAGGGLVTLAMTGINARAVLPPGGGKPIAVTADVDRAARPMLASLAGNAARYIPDEPMKVTATILPTGSLADASVDAPSMKVRVVPQAAGALAITVNGRSAMMLAQVPGAAKVLTQDQPVRASFTYRGTGAIKTFDAIDADVGDLHLGGQMKMVGNDLSGRVLVKAAHARTASMLFPGLLTVLPAQTLENPLVMPLDVTSSNGRMNVTAREATVGPLSISTDIAAEADGRHMAGTITMAGPIADSVLMTLPGWMRDALGPRQTLAARLVVDPQTAVTVHNLRIEGKNAQLAGDLTIPVRNSSFAWNAVQGNLGGAIANVRYGEFDIPQARYNAVLGKERLASAKVDMEMRGGGVVTVKLDLDHGQNGRLPVGNVEFTAEKLDLAMVCRDTGFRLFGSGQLDANLKGAVPGEVLVNANDGQALFDALMRSAQASGQLRIRDGALLDVDLQARGRDVDGGVGAGERTPFNEVAGSIALANGMLKLNDGRFVTPQYALDVSGGMQVPALVMDFTVRGQVVVLSRISTGQALAKATMPPLHILGRPSKPAYEFVPGTARVSQAAIDVAQNVQAVNEKVAAVQSKGDKFFSDKFFRPLVGKKKPAAPAAAPATPVVTASAAPSPAPEAPARRVAGPTRCGA